MKKILVTGASGFIGSNLCVSLQELSYTILSFDKDNTMDELKAMVQEADFVVHLAGINRPKNPEDFYKGNVGLTENLISYLEKYNPVPLLVSSSIQAGNDSDYGKSKLEGEKLVENYKGKGMVFRLSNVYGKWSRPNYNSVIATWCHNISHDLELVVNDPKVEVNFVYIDDVVKDIIAAIEGQLELNTYHEVKPIDTVSLGEVKNLLVSFKESRINLSFPNLKSNFSKNLYSTYLSYIPIDEMAYKLTMHQDHRGSFTEFLKDETLGQVSVNVSKPGITKGQHWHHSKNEKFLVVYGQGQIEIRHIITNEKFIYEVSGETLEVIDIPTGYTHNIINTGKNDMVTIMWANEMFDPNNPDTYFMEV